MYTYRHTHKKSMVPFSTHVVKKKKKKFTIIHQKEKEERTPNHKLLPFHAFAAVFLCHS